MMTRTKLIIILLGQLLWIGSVSSYASGIVDSVTLYTPFTKISVTPGESLEYPIDAINNSKSIQTVDVSVIEMPRGWNYTLKMGIWTVGEISILPAEKKSLLLKVEVPLRVNKGSYRFKIAAGKSEPLTLVMIVSEQGTFKTEFTTEQPNMQGIASSTFTFNTSLKNRNSDKQLYSLMAYAPRGWNVTFKVNYQAVTSFNVEANSSQSVIIEIKPPENIEAGKYKIPVNATTSSTSANLELEVAITGSYKMELTTPTGLLSGNITAGEEKRIELLIINTGTAELSDIKFEPSTPNNWSVTFDPKKVDKLQPAKSTQIFAIIKADKKAIPGDYVTNIDARTPEVSSRTSLRISVETPMLWGWIGVLIIIIALGSVYYLFRKYGRR